MYYIIAYACIILDSSFVTLPGRVNLFVKISHSCHVACIISVIVNKLTTCHISWISVLSQHLLVVVPGNMDSDVKRHYLQSTRTTKNSKLWHKMSYIY